MQRYLNMKKENGGPSEPLENVDLTPTQIARTLKEQTGKKCSAVKINKAMEKLGLQRKIKRRGKKWQWQLTPEGKKYGRVYQVESAYSTWTGNQIKWGEKIIDILEQNLFVLFG